MSAPRLHLTCCLCRKLIPQGAYVYALDREWQRRYPQMVGTLACGTCPVSSTYFFRCHDTRNDAYVSGHLRAADRGEARDVDSWSHIEAHGTQTALAYAYPWAAVQQGAEEWLRHILHQRPQLHSDVRARIQDALHRWDTTAAG